MRVVVQGERRLPAIVTYHDIGLNSKCYHVLNPVMTVVAVVCNQGTEIRSYLINITLEKSARK